MVMLWFNPVSRSQKTSQTNPSTCPLSMTTQPMKPSHTVFLSDYPSSAFIAKNEHPSLKNGSSSSTTTSRLEGEENIAVEETRPDMKIRFHVKGGDKLVSNNKSTAADFAPASSNEKEKETYLVSPSEPWNLRPRGNSHRVFNEKNGNPVLGTQDSGDQKKNNVEKKPAARTKLSIYLKRHEIEEDLFIMTGSKQASRQKPKRMRSEKQKKTLNLLFPGFRFNGLSADSFKIPKG